MLRCEDCEFFSRDAETGRITMKCDPFSTIKEPPCLEKMQLLRMDSLVQMYQAMLRFYQNMAPMQKKMFDMMKREMDDVDEAERWKQIDDDELSDDDDLDDGGKGRV
jgi:hypothetical protein